MKNMDSTKIQNEVKMHRGSIELLYEEAIANLERAASKWFLEHVKPCDTMDPNAIEVRDALRALELVREARV